MKHNAMKKLLPPFIVLIATFALGIGVTKYLRHRQTNRTSASNQPWGANPCRDGLALVDNTPAPTLKITLLETSCQEPVATVHFSVTNVGTTAIKYFNVRAIYSYDNYVDDGSEFGAGPLVAGQSTEGFIGPGTMLFHNGKQVGQLRGITLIPSLLEFEDGRKWRQPSIHEPRLK